MWFLFLTKGEESQTQVCFSNKPILLEEVFRYVHEKLTKNMIFLLRAIDTQHTIWFEDQNMTL